MKRSQCWLACFGATFFGALFFGATLNAQEVVEPFCVPENCNDVDPDCCIPDSLEIVFEDDLDNSVFEYDTFVKDTPLTVVVVSETQTMTVQGWSYGVAHDDAILTLDELSVTIEGTDAERLEQRGFCATAPVDGGWISAFVLSFRQPVELPLEARNTLAKATYALTADAGTDGTPIRLVHREIGPNGSPATDINITVDGRARSPNELTHGLVRRIGVVGDDDDDDDDCTGVPDWALYFGGAASTERVDARGADSLAVSIRNATDAFAFQGGVSYTPDGGDMAFSFSSALGVDADRLIELILTDENGDSQTPETPNTAIASGAATGVARGPAIAGFADDDFFEWDLNPGVGGDGFIVGYVSDLNDDTNKIPPTGTGNPCPVNEVLSITFAAVEGAEFQRGDVDGNGERNVTDAVLVIQVILMNLPSRYNCEDALDANDDGKLNIADALPILFYLFQRGDPLPDPFLSCGRDTSADGLTCATASFACQ